MRPSNLSSRQASEILAQYILIRNLTSYTCFYSLKNSISRKIFVVRLEIFKRWWKLGKSFSFFSIVASGPERVDDLCFHAYGELSPPSPSPMYPLPPASRPIFQPQGPNPSLEAWIPWGRKFGLKDRILAIRWDLGLEVGIWTSRLEFGSRGWDMSLQA